MGGAWEWANLMLRPRQYDDILKLIFWYQNNRILIQISLKFVPKGPVTNKSALPQVE